MKIEKRTEPLRIVREQEKVPGVLFGKTIDPVTIQIDEKDLHDLVKEFGYTKTFMVKLGKATHQVYIKGIQFDAIKKDHALNVKLLKVKEGDTIKPNVPLHYKGREKIEKPGIIVQIVSDSIDVEYPVGKGLSSFDVDVSNMKIGDVMHIKDLDLPDFLNVHDDPEKVLVHVAEVVFIEEEKETEAVEESPVDATEETASE